jgi:hypothetical protein
MLSKLARSRLLKIDTPSALEASDTHLMVLAFL